MNANQIINMVMKIFMRKAITKGVSMGIGAATKPRQAAPGPRHGIDIEDGGDAPKMTQEEKRRMREARRASRAANEQTRNAQQAMKVARRVTRM